MHVIRERLALLAMLVGAPAVVGGGCGDSPGPTGDGTPVSLEVTPSEITLAPEETRALAVSVKDAAGSELGTTGVSWSSADEAVATVSASGVVRGVSEGTTVVTAALGALSDEVAVEVTGEPVPVDAVIVVDAGAQYQTMKGWESTAEAGQLECPTFPLYRDELLDRAVEDLGLNRIRLEIGSGLENRVDYFALHRAGQLTRAEWSERWYDPRNDNDDPYTIDPAGFQFSHLDYNVDMVVNPLRQRLAARGERLYVSLNYVDFDNTQFEHKETPEEYAEFILAAFLHLQSRYGWVPDAVEIILEPDIADWTAAQTAAALVAVGNRLKAHGFSPEFVAPSNASMAGAVTYFDQIIQTPGAAEYLSMLSFHRYRDVSQAALQAIDVRRKQHGIATGMLEHISSDHADLKQDLRVANVSAWQQYALAFCGGDDGSMYFPIDETHAGAPVVLMSGRSRYLRQYFLWVRHGAVRIGASTTDGDFDPVAFVNVGGKHVVVVDAARAGTLRVSPLPAGTYGINYTTATDFDVNGGDIVLASGQPLVTAIPASGVITIYAK